MNSNLKTALILAAGSGRRMMPLTKDRPKSLLEYKDSNFLKRIIFQLLDNNIENIYIVIGYLKDQIIKELEGINNIHFIINDRYEEDVNIYSVYLALNQIKDKFILIEADTIIDDEGMAYVTSNEFGNKSVWFTNGLFKDGQYGGILKSNENKEIEDIKIVKKYEDQYKFYKKLTGLMRIGENELPKFRDLVENYVKNSIKEYYLKPWIENLKFLPAIESDIKDFEFATFNTPEDYQNVRDNFLSNNVFSNDFVKLLELKKLKHIEGFDPNKVNYLVEKISKDGIWTKPLYVERNYFLVLDGQHRMEAAIKLNFKKIPVQLFDYNDVELWSLRSEEIVSRELVIKRSLNNDVYPYKTVKHSFKDPITKIRIGLDQLI